MHPSSPSSGALLPQLCMYNHQLPLPMLHDLPAIIMPPDSVPEHPLGSTTMSKSTPTSSTNQQKPQRITKRKAASSNLKKNRHQQQRTSPPTPSSTPPQATPLQTVQLPPINVPSGELSPTYTQPVYLTPPYTQAPSFQVLPAPAPRYSYTSPRASFAVPTTSASTSPEIKLSNSPKHASKFEYTREAGASTASDYISSLANLEQMARHQQRTSRYMPPANQLAVSELYIGQLDCNESRDGQTAPSPGEESLQQQQQDQRNSNASSNINNSNCSNNSTNNSSTNNRANSTGSITEISLLPSSSKLQPQLTNQFHQEYLDMCVPQLARGNSDAADFWRRQVPQLACYSSAISIALVAYTTLTMARSRFISVSSTSSSPSSFAAQSKQMFKTTVTDLWGRSLPVPLETTEEVFICVMLLVNYIHMDPTAVPVVASKENELDFFSIARSPFCRELHDCLDMRKQNKRTLAAVLGGISNSANMVLPPVVVPCEYKFEFLDMLVELLNAAAADNGTARDIISCRACGPSTQLSPTASTTKTTTTNTRILDFLPGERDTYASTIAMLGVYLHLALTRSPAHLMEMFVRVSGTFLEYYRDRRPFALVIGGYMLVFCALYSATTVTCQLGDVEDDVSQFMKPVQDLEDMLEGPWKPCLYWPKKIVNSQESGGGLGVLRSLIEGL